MLVTYIMLNNKSRKLDGREEKRPIFNCSVTIDVKQNKQKKSDSSSIIELSK